MNDKIKPFSVLFEKMIEYDKNEEILKLSKKMCGNLSFEFFVKTLSVYYNLGKMSKEEMDVFKYSFTMLRLYETEGFYKEGYETKYLFVNDCLPLLSECLNSFIDKYNFSEEGEETEIRKTLLAFAIFVYHQIKYFDLEKLNDKDVNKRLSGIKRAIGLIIAWKR